MSWTGSGAFQRLYNWVTDRDAGIAITASRMDAEMDGMATGITACLAKNGENAATADLPMGGYAHTNVAASSARTEYARTDQVQDSSFTYSSETGAADAYVISPVPAITAYANGQRFSFIASATNTGASTLNVSSVGAQPILTWYGAALPAGAITADRPVEVMVYGSNFILLSWLTSADFAAIDGLTSAANKMIRYTGSGTADLVDFIDEDDMASDSDSALPSQQSVKAYVDDSAPVGTIAIWATTTPPSKWLELDGSSFSAVTYPELNTVLGTTTLLDLRGEFIRGWDNGRGIDSGRSIGSGQGQEIQSHTHNIGRGDRVVSAGDMIGLGSNNVYGNAANAQATGGSETRPRNGAVMFIIKAE